MKIKSSFLVLLIVPTFHCLTGCTSDQMGASNNPNPRRTYNAATGDYEGPTPMPPPAANSGANR